MKEATDIYVLDTSAWLAFIEDEDGVDVVQRLLEDAKAGRIVILVSFMTFMEVYYITLQERDEVEAQERLQLMSSLPILRIESTKELGILAGRLKRDYQLSVADGWIAALARERNAILVHKDPEFEQVGKEITLLKLPYKTST
jgi:predicted nucleic acid-binding protein